MTVTEVTVTDSNTFKRKGQRQYCSCKKKKSRTWSPLKRSNETCYWTTADIEVTLVIINDYQLLSNRISWSIDMFTVNIDGLRPPTSQSERKRFRDREGGGGEEGGRGGAGRGGRCRRKWKHYRISIEYVSDNHRVHYLILLVNRPSLITKIWLCSGLTHLHMLTEFQRGVQHRTSPSPPPQTHTSTCFCY